MTATEVTLTMLLSQKPEHLRDCVPALVVVRLALTRIELPFDAPPQGPLSLPIDPGQFVRLSDGKGRPALAGDLREEVSRQVRPEGRIGRERVGCLDAVDQVVARVVHDEKGDLVLFWIEDPLAVDLQRPVGEDPVGADPRAKPVREG